MQTCHRFSSRMIRSSLRSSVTAGQTSTMRCISNKSSYSGARSIALGLRMNRRSFATAAAGSKSGGIANLFGNSVVAPFTKGALFFWMLPVSAVMSAMGVNTLPLDAAFGALLPYHAYTGLAHIFTDYAPRYMPVATALGVVMFVGLQRLNFSGEGISHLVYRAFSSRPMPTKTTSVLD